MELNIKDFDDLENYFKKKAQHVEELEHLNTELTIENRRLKREIREIEDLCLQENRKLQLEVDRLKKSQAEYINHILKKSPAATEDSLDNYSYINIPQIFKGREQSCQ